MVRQLIGSVGVILALAACGDDETSSTPTPPSATTTGDGPSGDGPGDDGGGGGGATPVAGSDGCDVPTDDPPESWVEKTLSVGDVERRYYRYLPSDYDPGRPYPVVYQFHGCSANPERQNNNPPVQDASGGDAIHIRGRAEDNCWTVTPDSPDIAYFDALVAEVESGACADRERRFATGYSSGAFLTHLLACARGDVLRGVGSIAGGLAGSDCTGSTAALLIHDDTDGTVDIETSERARDRHLDTNGCRPETTPTSPEPCVAHTCDAGLPVVWCPTTGNGHGRQDGLAAPAFWSFFSSLP